MQQFSSSSPDVSRTLSQADLARMHPLYARMTGQVVWVMFEEREIDPEIIDGFMSEYVTTRETALVTLGALLDPDSPITHFRIEKRCDLPLPDPFCRECAALEGKIIPVSRGDMLRFFPPFSLGCRLRAAPVPENEPIDQNALLPEDAAPPPSGLYCKDEWIFRTDWRHYK